MATRRLLRRFVRLTVVLLVGGSCELGLAQESDNLVDLNEQVIQLYSKGAYQEAISIAERAARLAERKIGADDSEVGRSLNTLGALYRAVGRYAEAEPLFKRAIAIAEAALGPDHPNVGGALNNLAGLYSDQGRYAEAEILLKRDLAISEKALGGKHLAVGGGLNSLAALYERLGRHDEAEPLYRRALGIFEAALGPDHFDVATLLNNFAELYRSQGRSDEAQPLLKRALAIAERALRPEDPRIATLLSNLASLYRDEGRYAEAETLYRRSLAISESAFGAEHPNVGIALSNLGQLLISRERYEEAEPILLRALSISERALGPDHPDTAVRLNNLAVMHRRQGRYGEAARLHLRSLAIREKALGADHPDVGQSLNNLGALAYLQGDWQEAASFWRRSTAIIIQRTKRDPHRLGQSVTGARTSEAELLKWQFWGLVQAGYRLSQQHPAAAPALSREMFTVAQRGLASQTAGSLAQMAARGAKGDPAIAALVRERQDLVAEWQTRDRTRSAALARPPDKRDSQAEANNVARLAVIDARIGAIDERLAQDFPDYAVFARSAPLAIEEVQANLREDEALVFFLDTPQWDLLPEETFIWVVTKHEVRWTHSQSGTAFLTREVAALRCGLDAAAWLEAGARCAEALERDSARVYGGALPFDRDRSHRLYKALFGAVEDLIAGKTLLVVPSGPLTQLPFHVLVTEPPTSPDHRAAAWLVRRHALAVLPTVSALKALRRIARPSAATRAMVGVGNPLLDGPAGQYTEAARLARQLKMCPPGRSQGPTAETGQRSGVSPFTLRSGLADMAHLKAQAPLPETADELCTVASILGAEPGDVLLGADATERQVKALSNSGTLAQYRIVHFATHGALAGDLVGTTEPGLILTPPNEATAEDDGYLSASEIAGLRLDADWVILSACNTAAGGARGAEALSGLARAFFYAQARTLLVSHWAVDSLSTVKLITSAVREIRAGGRVIGRAEALRRAMLAHIDDGAPHEAHPSLWAPFVVVGESAER